MQKVFAPAVKAKENKSDWFFEFENKSQIWLAGTDDKERLEKLLGNEWATIYMNEASQMSYDTYEILKTRLNPPKDVKPLFLIDYNPPSMTHWGYLLFHKKLNPENKQPLKDKGRYAMLKMNPGDNIDNLSKGYIQTLESMSEAKKRRFLHGEYSDDSENALWKREWIIQNRVDKVPEKLDRIVVAVDPAVTGKENSDDTGIIIIGKYSKNKDTHYIVLDDRTFHGSVHGWGEQVVKAYHDFKADKVIGEVNQGGDLVEMNIRNYDRNINYDSVRATRGKAVRAEPVSDLYRRGLVHHYGVFQDLEDQMASWTPESDDSPDNMDALVWGVSYLAGIGNKTLQAASMSAGSFGL